MIKLKKIPNSVNEILTFLKDFSEVESAEVFKRRKTRESVVKPSRYVIRTKFRPDTHKTTKLNLAFILQDKIKNMSISVVETKT